MDIQRVVLFSLVPVVVVVAFVVHWITIARVDSAEGRLPLCRGAYLALSFQLVAFAWTVFVAFKSTSPAAILIAFGMTMSFLGDTFNLQFPGIARRVNEPLFFGIVSFAIAQVCYIAAFLSIVPLSALVSTGYLAPIAAVLIVVPAILFKLRVYSRDRPRSVMAGAFFYGFILGGMAAVAIAAAIAFGGYWYIVAAGALFFLLSDAIMGETTIHGRHPRNEYQVPWITYLIAQGLIILGMALL